MRIIRKFNLNDANDRGYCLAPNRLVTEKLKVRFMYREAPDNDQDSGWRFFSGDETDEYVNDPDNIGIYDVSTVAMIDNDIIPFLDEQVGSAFEREDASDPFAACEFDFGE